MDIESLLRTAEEHFSAGLNPEHKEELLIAADLYQQLIELNPNNNSEDLSLYHHTRGCAFGLLKRFDDAITEFTKSIELDSQPGYTSYFNRGIAYKFLGKFNEAIADFTKAIEINPVSAESYSHRGSSYRFMGDAESAKKDYEKTLELFEQKKTDIFYGDNYEHAIRAEKGLVKLGLRTEVTIEQKALENKILTKELLNKFFENDS